MQEAQEQTSVTLRIPKILKEQYQKLAEYSHRSLNSQVNLALSDWLRIKEELHPQFVADIKEALSGVKSGKVEPVWKG